MVFTDPGYRLADGAGHARSSALRGGGGSAFATTQAKCARKLADEEVAFGVDLRGPLGVPGGAGVLEVVVDLGEASAVGKLGLRVEELARVAEGRARQGCHRAGVAVPAAGGLGGDKIEHVILPSRIGEKPGEVSHAFEVAYPVGVPVERHGPVVPLAMKDVQARTLLDWECMIVLNRWGHRRHGLDAVEDRAG